MTSSWFFLSTLYRTFYFCVSMHRSKSQIKHQLDATLCRFYFCRVTLHVSGVKRPSSGVLKNWHGGPWYRRTSGRSASFLILLMMGAWRTKHVEWLCRNKTCTVLHQVGVLFDLLYCAVAVLGPCLAARHLRPHLYLVRGQGSLLTHPT